MRNIQPCFLLSGQIKDKVPDSRYYAYSTMCESHTHEAQTSEENFVATGICLDFNEDVRTQQCFGLSGWIEDKSDEVPDDSRYAHSTMGECCTYEVHTSKEFVANGTTSTL